MKAPNIPGTEPQSLLAYLASSAEVMVSHHAGGAEGLRMPVFDDLWRLPGANVKCKPDVAECENPDTSFSRA